MGSLRRRLQVWVVIWLVFQVASLSALVPRDCCAAHRPATREAKPQCHEEVAAPHCHKRAADGAQCPMHQGGHGGHEQPSTDKCALRGTCDGPMAALLALLTNHGILTDGYKTLPDLHLSAVTLVTSEQPLTRLATPDPPPPRA